MIIKKNTSQFITIFLMVLIGVMAYSGIKAYMDGMTDTASRFYSKNNLQDINVIGTKFTENDLTNIKNIEHINNAERKLEIPVTNSKNKDISYLLTIIETNEISKFEVVDGIPFDASKSGIWIDKYHADANDIKVGDKISFKYDNYEWEEKVLGIIFIPDHIYTVKDASALFPDYKVFGSIYMSYIELEYYIKSEAMEKLRKELKEDALKKDKVIWFDGHPILWNPICLNFAHTSDNPSEASMNYAIGYPEYQVMTRFMYPNLVLERKK